MKQQINIQPNFPLKITAYLVIIITTFITLGPLIWLAYTSLKPHNDIVENIFSFPKSLNFANYSKAWKLGQLGRGFFNSIIYAGVSTFFTTMLALSAGFGFSRLKFKISKFLQGFFMIGLLITIHSVLVPLFILETKLNIDDSYIGIILPYIALNLPFAVFLAVSFMRGLPESLEEAARIDGCGYGRIFFHIIIPLSTPVIATIIIFTFLSTWNEFALAYTLTSSPLMKSLQVGINSFAGGRTRDYGLQLTSLVIGTGPMIIFYFLFNKQIAKGFAAGALKE